MDTEQPPMPPVPDGSQGDTPATIWPVAPQEPSGTRSRTQYALLGIATIVVVGSLLYGPNMMITALGFLVICTIGIGLIPLFLVSLMVGWVELSVWDAVKEATGRSGPAVPQGSAKG
ncbi:MAG TPA: hypothetical protein VIR16_12805 [Candidatus Limnocylindrales bacterium]